MKIIENRIQSKRDTKIPVTIVEADLPSKLLLFVHGFKAGRTEDGRFLTVATELSKQGVCSIMMGFPGCDESDEDFINYSLRNCIDDIDASYDYMMEHYDLDRNSVGMIGYSMGGRLTSLYIAEHPEISCIGLWAAAVEDGFGDEGIFLGEDVETMKKEAKEKGFCNFHNLFDDTWIRLSRELIEDMEEKKPSVGLKNYKGAAILVHGDEDSTVPYRIAELGYVSLKEAKERKLYCVKGADHGFGAWNDRPDLSKQLTENTVSFFKEHFA